jgi:hypothetical protein
MIDSEVIRLRRLRNTALRARAIAAGMDDKPLRSSSVFSRSAQGCWRIARVATGRLRTHPHLGFQRGPSHLRALCDRVTARLLRAVARYRGQSQQIFATELQRVARELDDTRALTRCAELSDDLGRLQIQIRQLLKELDAAVRQEAGPHIETQSRVDAPSGFQERPSGFKERGDADVIEGNWPYLAF